MLFVVAGSTGNTGFAVVQALSQLDNSVQIRALTRSKVGKSPAHEALRLMKNVELVEYDSLSALNDTIFDSADAAFLVSHNSRGQVEAEKKFIDAAVASVSCRYLVKVGTVRGYTAMDSEIKYARFHAEIEDYLEEEATDNLIWTVLCPNWFMSNHLGDIFGTLPQANITAYPVSGDAKVAMVDPRDVGDAAAHLLLSVATSIDDGDTSPYHGLKLDISGPEKIDMTSITEMYSTALQGRKVQHVKCSSEDWVAGAIKAGFEDWLAEAITGNFTFWEAGKLMFPTSPQILALAPPNRTMSQWIDKWAPRSPPPAVSGD